MEQGRIFAMGDIHGAYKAFIQCLERSGFDKEKDTLIQLGDVVDGWNEVYECVEELLSIKNLIAIKGNHDDWFDDWLTMGNHPTQWLQGGSGTLHSYCENTGSQYFGTDSGGYRTSLNSAVILESHKKFFAEQVLYYIDNENRIFTHGGFKRTEFVDYLAVADPYNFYWDRDLWRQAKSCTGGQKLKTANEFKEIFIGHTTTVNDSLNERGMRDFKPVHSGGVWNLDQGAGWHGKLTIMNVETKEYFQSDEVSVLYEGIKGRN